MLKFILIALVLLGGFYFFGLELPFLEGNYIDKDPEERWEEFDQTVEKPSILIFEKLTFAPKENVSFQVDNAMGEIIELPENWSLELYSKNYEADSEQKVADHQFFKFADEYYSFTAPETAGFYSVKMLNPKGEEEYETRFMVN
jgi:hypothetical protein